MINRKPFSAGKEDHAVNHQCVGIVFMRGDDLWIDSTPVIHAVDYGELKTHEKGHADYWEELQAQHLVPADEEYDEVSRGRVSYDIGKDLYYLFLDRCIRSRPKMVSRIFQAMHLPPWPATQVGGDSHYVCPGCKGKELDEGPDW